MNMHGVSVVEIQSNCFKMPMQDRLCHPVLTWYLLWLTKEEPALFLPSASYIFRSLCLLRAYVLNMRHERIASEGLVQGLFRVTYSGQAYSHYLHVTSRAMYPISYGSVKCVRMKRYY